MALHTLPAPVPAQRCLETALVLSEAPAPRELPYRQVESETGSLPLYRLDSVGGPLPTPQLAGWRFLLDEGAGVPRAAETMLTADGWAFSHFLAGPYVASTARAVRQAQTLVTDYQPRLLSIPRLYTMALWLHAGITASAEEGRPAPEDLLMPLAPAPPGIAAYRPLAVAELLRLLSARVTGAHRPRLARREPANP